MRSEARSGPWLSGSACHYATLAKAAGLRIRATPATKPASYGYYLRNNPEGAMRDQLPHQARAGARIEVQDIPVQQSASDHRGMQRGVAERGGVRISPLVQQVRCERPVTAVRRHHQRGVPVGRGVLHIGSSGDQQPGRLQIARPRRKQQGGAATLLNFFQRDAARRRPGGPATAHAKDKRSGRGAGVDVRAMLEERPRDLRLR